MNTIEIRIFSSHSLTTTLDDINAYINQHSRDYYWNYEQPRFSVSNNEIHASFDVADCLDDEWFAVYLFKNMTIHLKHIAVMYCHFTHFRIKDCDGQFLLIEAADVLPKWLSPESSKNRVPSLLLI
jgi:hypothetical protein